jgi:four helix bundle protein
MAYGFEKLDVWNMSTDLLIEVYGLTARYPKTEIYALVSQTRRAANSVVANIAEATGRHFYKDKIRIFYIARGEIEETKSHLLVALRLGYIDRKDIDNLLEQYSILHKKLNGLISVLVKNQLTS